jgi:hypothetical protein
MTALLVALALMNVRLMLFPKVISTKLTLMYAPIVVHAPMFVRLKLFTLNKQFE